ncbi:hypothetical protein B0H19DRAFT_1255089 [Mycena capillaripes]|nr:hypothetical protein B0H19DRAFT_1255089 [Mycena capillaripes]
MAYQYPLIKTFIVAAWLEAILYGIYFCMFWFGVYINGRGGRSVNAHNRIMFATSVIMFIVATLHVAMNGYRAIVGYVDFETAPGHHIMKDVLYTIQSLLGDAMAVYRCWILWNRNYRFVVLPFCLLLTSAISGSMVTVLFATIDPTASIFDPRLTNWITVFTSVAVAQNIITTGLMGFRLWEIERKSTRIRIGGGVFLPILKILVESAALYLFVEIMLLALYQANYNAQYILLETITPVVGITFGMITIRIMLRSQQTSRSPTSDGRLADGPGGGISLRRIAVNISTHMEDDRADGKMAAV